MKTEQNRRSRHFTNGEHALLREPHNQSRKSKEQKQKQPMIDQAGPEARGAQCIAALLPIHHTIVVGIRQRLFANPKEQRIPTITRLTQNERAGSSTATK